MISTFISLAAAVMIGFTLPALGQTLPTETRGSWDVSFEECRASGTSITQIDISANAISTFGGNAIVRDIDRSGPVTFVAADFLQLEGAAELGERERAYYRLTQRNGPDRLNFRWKDVHTVDLVRCDHDVSAREGETASSRLENSTIEPRGLLPIPTGLWVVAGEDCESPANASWRVYDGRGLYGAQSESCEIIDVSSDGRRHVIEQICTATYDGSKTKFRDAVHIQAPKRFGLIEDGETEMQDFNWCGSRLWP